MSVPAFSSLLSLKTSLIALCLISSGGLSACGGADETGEVEVPQGINKAPEEVLPLPPGPVGAPEMVSPDGQPIGPGAGPNVGPITQPVDNPLDVPVLKSHLNIVAHQDDDLLFINPDIARAIDAGEAVATVYLTSGDAELGAPYVAERERGIKAAYSLMAREPNDWTCGAFTLANKSIERCVHDEKESLELYYLRLQDGFAAGQRSESLLKLWTGSVTVANAVVGGGSFTRSEMLAVLDAILKERKVTNIYTTDFLFENSDDHSDHEIAALFALAASSAFKAEHELTTHRTYNISNEPANISSDDLALVKSVFEKYAACDVAIPGCSGTADCETNSCSTVGALYTNWYSRNYKEARVAPFSAQSIRYGTNCLSATSMGVSAATCDSSAGQSWSYQDDYTLALADGSGCLTASNLGSFSSTLSLTPCAGAESQRFALMSGGKIIFAAPPNEANDATYTQSFCLGGPDWGSTVTVGACSATANQKWSTP